MTKTAYKVSGRNRWTYCATLQKALALAESRRRQTGVFAAIVACKVRA